MKDRVRGETHGTVARCGEIMPLNSADAQGTAKHRPAPAGSNPATTHNPSLTGLITPLSEGRNTHFSQIGAVPSASKPGATIAGYQVGAAGTFYPALCRRGFEGVVPCLRCQAIDGAECGFASFTASTF